MRIEIDINKIAQEIEINKLVEEKILSDVSETIDIENIVDEILENEEMKNHINRKIINIINEYISSEEGKNRIIDAFNDVVINSDILADEKVINLVAGFLKKHLNI